MTTVSSSLIFSGVSVQISRGSVKFGGPQDATTFWARRDAGMIGVLPSELPSKAKPPAGVETPNSVVP